MAGDRSMGWTLGKQTIMRFIIRIHGHQHHGSVSLNYLARMFTQCKHFPIDSLEQLAMLEFAAAQPYLSEGIGLTNIPLAVSIQVRSAAVGGSALASPNLSGELVRV